MKASKGSKITRIGLILLLGAALLSGCTASGQAIGDNGTPAHIIIDNQNSQPIIINLFISQNGTSSNFTWTVTP